MKTFLGIVLFFVSVVAYAQQVDVKESDMRIFSEYVNYINAEEYGSKQDIIQKTAEFFLEKPYVAGTLDGNETEMLVVNLHEFDCVTYIETVIALANMVESGDITFLNFVSKVREIRYREGVVDGYASRLHYTSDWVYVNQQKGILAPILWQDENVLDTKRINFMSKHRHAYNALNENDDMLAQIENIENDINERGGFVYLPKRKIAENADKIPHMAMIAFTTSIEGLDTTHTGFTYKRDDGTLGFIHASSLKKKVVIDKKSLSEYCISQKACKGLIIMSVK